MTRFPRAVCSRLLIWWAQRAPGLLALTQMASQTAHISRGEVTTDQLERLGHQLLRLPDSRRWRNLKELVDAIREIDRGYGHLAHESVSPLELKWREVHSV